MFTKLSGFIFLALLSASAVAGDVRLTWSQDTTTCADGSPMATDCPLKGFRINEGTTVDNLALKETLTDVSLRSRTYTGLAAGTTKCYSLHSFTGTAASPILSGESSKVCVTVPFVGPKAPQGLKVEVVVKLTVESTSPAPSN